MSIRAEDNNYAYERDRTLLPIRWSAPETFELKSFSEKSDV